MNAAKQSDLLKSDETEYRNAEAERQSIAGQLHAMEVAHNEGMQPLIARQRELCQVIENLLCNAGEW